MVHLEAVGGRVRVMVVVLPQMVTPVVVLVVVLRGGGVGVLAV